MIKELDRIVMGERIRTQREFLSLSREQLAEKMGITAKFIYDIESGQKGLSLQNFTRLIQILAVSADYLLLGETANRGRQLVCEVHKYYLE